MPSVRMLTAGVASSLFALAAVVVPATTAQAAAQADSCTQNWSISSTEGHASGQWCNYNTKIKGTVTDDRADGRCPFVRAYMSGGSYKDSPWVGPKGTSKYFELTAWSGQSFTSVAMKYVAC
ncbi:hypothetical protein [Streptomyces sp. NPDC057580]|uniref:hypothetical protein n=1 Tax=Streptomyces sp. NPDC057580 TaxID=3346173 RepID=UPI0036C49922